jgi:glycosyltransferase involved in cell wall biosynthesis
VQGEGARAPRVGVNVAGYFGSTLGVGQSARSMREALRAAGVPVAAVPLSARGGEAVDIPFALTRPEDAAFPVNLVCANADGLDGARAQLGERFFEGRRTVGVWWWEAGPFPERWARAFDPLDEVWVGSSHVASMLAPAAPIPVLALPMPVPPPAPADVERSRLGPPGEGFVFLYVFDYDSVFERKNPLAAVEAFARAFADAGGTRLVLKCLGADSHPAAHRRILEAAGGHPGVEVVDRMLTPTEMAALVEGSDCYVSLHRAEGFGLTIAEAMLRGKPVIATGWSGPLDYLTPLNSYLVDYQLVPVGEGNDPYPAEGIWAEPDLDHAAALMREVVERPDEARRRAERGRAEVEAAHSPAAAGAAMAARIARLEGMPTGSRNNLGAMDLDPLERRIRSDEPPPAADRGRGRRLLRSLALRAGRPQRTQQRLVDEELVAALRTLEERLGGLSASHASVQAQLEALERRLEQLERP